MTQQRDSELGDRAALPADRDGRAVLFAFDVEDDFVDQGAQQLFAVAVGGRGRGPHAAEVAAEREQLLALSVGQRLRALLLAQRELGFGLGELAERVLPVALQAAGDEPVLGLDLAVAALRPSAWYLARSTCSRHCFSAASWSCSSASAA